MSKTIGSVPNSGYFIVFFLLLMSFSSQAQFYLEGQVRDAETGIPVPVFDVQTDSVHAQFSNGIFRVLKNSRPRKLIVSAKGYLPFKLSDFPEKTLPDIYLIPEHVNIEEVIVKAFQSGKRVLDTPGAISLITNSQLLREPAFTLAPAVNKTAGVWMQSGSVNTNRLTIRGIGARSPYGSNKIRAYYGNIPLTNGVGETTPEDLDLEQIADIEIVKGPASGFYGSGLGGVLLFNPVKPGTNQFSQFVSVGSYQTIKYTGKLAISGKNASHSLVYSRLHSDGYRENNETNRHNLTWTTSVTRNRTQIDLLVTYTNMLAFIPSSIDWKTFQESPEKAAANWAATKGYENYERYYAGISVQQKLNKNWLLRISPFSHINQNDELRPFNILQEKNHYLGFRTALEKMYRSTNTILRLIAGNEFFNETFQWQTFQNKNRIPGALLSNNEELRGYNNLFVLTDFSWQQKLFVSASLNYNQTHYNYNDRFLTDGDQSGKHRFNPEVSPRLAANLTVSPKTRLFLVVSRGFSPPTLEETLMPSGQRNTSIKPETGWNFELGTKATIGQSLYLEFSAYYMKVKNLLVARRTADDAYTGINAGSTNHPGLEIKMDYKLIERPEWSAYFRVNGSFTHYRFARFIDDNNDYSGNKLTGTPAAITNWMLETLHHKGFFVNLHFQTVGRMPIRDDNTLYTKAYQLTNLMAGYEKTFRKISLSVSSGIQNLLDTHYASMVLINATAVGSQSPRYYYPGLPRNFKSTISLKYAF